jgi:hypothetical protein
MAAEISKNDAKIRVDSLFRSAHNPNPPFRNDSEFLKAFMAFDEAREAYEQTYREEYVPPLEGGRRRTRHAHRKRTIRKHRKHTRRTRR